MHVAPAKAIDLKIAKARPPPTTAALRSVDPPDQWLSCALAFVGGYGDAVGFVIAKTFAGHITGSMVLLAVAVAAGDSRGAVEHLLAVACFLSGVVLSVVIAHALAKRSSWRVLPTALGIELVLIVAAYFASASHANAALEYFVVCMSLALGLQNGVFRRTGGTSVHTTYLTGMITDLIATQAETYLSRPAPVSATGPNAKFRLLYAIWAAFLLGAGAGSAMAFRFKTLGTLGAAVLLLVIIVREAMAGGRTEGGSPRHQWG